MQEHQDFNLSNLDGNADSESHNSCGLNIHDATTTKSSSRLPTLVVACEENDVLLGRGRVGWIGNQRFQYEARRNAQRYTNTHSRYEKSRIVLEIIGTVQAWGGRFLCKPKPSAKAAAIKATASASTLRKGSEPTFAIATLGNVRKKVGQVSVCNECSRLLYFYLKCLTNRDILVVNSVLFILLGTSISDGTTER